MGFELFDKGSHFNIGLPEDELSVAKTCITFGRKARQHLKKSFVEVYLDRNENKVGLKPSDNSMKGFKIFKKEEQETTSIVGSFMKLLPKGRYKCYIEEGYLIFNVPEIAKRNRDEQ